jgi:hypothetical protein
MKFSFISEQYIYNSHHNDGQDVAESICLCSIYTHRCACRGCSSSLFNDASYIQYMTLNEGIIIEQCNEGMLEEEFLAWFKTLFSIYLVRLTKAAKVPSVYSDSLPVFQRNRGANHSTVAFDISPSPIRLKAESVLHFPSSSLTVLFAMKPSGM